MSIVLADVLGQGSLLLAGSRLREAQTVVFSSSYPPGGVSVISKDTVRHLESQLGSGGAYTSVLNNADIQGEYQVNGSDVLVVVGDSIPDLFKETGICSPAPCASLDARVDHSSESVAYRSMSFPVKNRLQWGSVWFDPNAAGLPLDNRIVINLRPADLSKLDEYGLEEAVIRVGIPHADPHAVSAWIAGVARSGLYLIPQDLAHEQPERFRDLMIRSSIYVVALVAFAGLAVGAFVGSSMNLVARERRNFAIRKMCGATRLNILIEIAVLLAIPSLVLPLAVCLMLGAAGPPTTLGAAAAAITVVVIYAGILMVVWSRAESDVAVGL